MCIEPDVTKVENSTPSPVPTPEPVTDILNEDHVENINIIFIGHVGKIKVFYISFSSSDVFMLNILKQIWKNQNCHSTYSFVI